MSDMETLDTIALLQDEIARLEEELRLRDEAVAAAPAAPLEGETDAQLRASEQRMQDLGAELAKRDETIELLWDQVRGLEESQAVLLADWQEVEQWVEQLEQRAEAGADPARAGLLERPASASSGSLQDCPGDPPADPKEPAPEEPCRTSGLEEELLHRVRLAETVLHAREAEYAAFRERTSCEIEEYRQEIERLKSELERFRHTEQGEPPELSPDERIRAFRRHLMDVHIQECEERRSRTLVARLTKLFQRTAI